VISAYEIARSSLIAHEGFRSKAYECTEGYITIGIGRNLETNGISESEGEYLLMNDINRCIADLKKFDFWDDLNARQQAGLIDLRFCVGQHGLLKFKKMLLALTLGDYAEAALQVMDSQFKTQTGNRADHIAYLFDPAQGKPWQ